MERERVESSMHGATDEEDLDFTVHSDYECSPSESSSSEESDG